jgi:hypothetical protein
MVSLLFHPLRTLAPALTMIASFSMSSILLTTRARERKQFARSDQLRTKGYDHEFQATEYGCGTASKRPCRIARDYTLCHPMIRLSTPRSEPCNGIWHGFALNGGTHVKLPKLKPLVDFPNAPAGSSCTSGSTIDESKLTISSPGIRFDRKTSLTSVLDVDDDLHFERGTANVLHNLTLHKPTRQLRHVLVTSVRLLYWSNSYLLDSLSRHHVRSQYHWPTAVQRSSRMRCTLRSCGCDTHFLQNSTQARSKIR